MAAPDLTERIIDTICPALAGQCTLRRNGRPVQWSLRCPVHRGQRRNLTLKIERGRIVACCHRKPPCAWEEIRDALSKLCPGIVPQRRAARPVTVDVEVLVHLATLGLPSTAQSVGMLRLAGFSAEKARAELGLSKSSYYRALSQLGTVPNLGRNRRSA